MEDDTMVAKTIWLLLLCISCKVVMAFEGFDDSQVCWTYYISSLEAVGLSISMRLFIISSHLGGVRGPKINGHTHLSGTNKVQVYHSWLRGVNWCWVTYFKET